MSNLINKFLILAVVVFCIGNTGCINYKKFLYFKDLPEQIPPQGEVYKETQFTDIKIKTDDLLQVTVQTIDAQTSIVIGSTPLTAAAGYMVDKAGNIDLPLVGTVNVVGKTTLEAKELIIAKASILYKDPIVNVRFANFQVTLLGEITSPGTHFFANEKVTILDAIAASGDLTIYGKRSDILLIRTENGERKIVRLNINSADIFNSPYYYLKQRDIIYVVPNKSKVAGAETLFTRNIGVVTTALSLITISLNTYLLIKANQK